MMLFLTAVLAVGMAPAAKPPNVILIMADDFGYECVRANGGLSYETPHLDRMAREGTRCRHCWAQPLCTPTRVQLMTGQYNVRNYVQFGMLDRGQTTFAQLFRKAGYATGIVGKWQLGRELDSPQHFGFNDALLWQHTRRPPRYANPGLEHNGKMLDFSQGEYGPDLVNAHALKFIAEHKDRPFFLYYPMILTHNPFQPTPRSPNWDPRAHGEKVNDSPKNFPYMVSHTDRMVGNVLQALDQHNLAENTLVLFLGDNGTLGSITSRLEIDGRELSVRGGKGQSTLAGMHVPLIVRWPGRVQAEIVNDDIIDTTDFLPTICEAARITLPTAIPCDGHSFLPRLCGQLGKPREWTYSWYSRNGGPTAQTEFVADGRYKLYADGSLVEYQRDREEKNPLDLANLTDDARAAKEKMQQVLNSFEPARAARKMKN